MNPNSASTLWLKRVPVHHHITQQDIAPRCSLICIAGVWNCVILWSNIDTFAKSFSAAFYCDVRGSQASVVVLKQSALPHGEWSGSTSTEPPCCTTSSNPGGTNL